MMKANYLIALVYISLVACGDNPQELTTSRADSMQMLKEDLDKTFGTGRIYGARMEKDGMHLKTEKGNIVIPLKELEKLEQGASMHVKENAGFLSQLFNAANARGKCEWVNCGNDKVGRDPKTCKYHC